MKLQKRIQKQQDRRAYHVRNTVRASGRIRLSVFRSNQHIYAQIIDDEKGVTLVSASSAEKDGLAELPHGNTVSAAAAIGKRVAERALAAGVTSVAFDRGSYRYHGRVAALAEAARESGLQF